MSNDMNGRYNYSDKKRYLHYFARELFEQKLLHDRLKFKRNDIGMFGGILLPDENKTNQIIYDAIESGKPFALVRPGNGETSIAVQWEEIHLFGKRLYVRNSENWNNFQKVYGEEFEKYNKMFLKDISDADILAVFPDMILGEYIAEKYCSNAKWISMNNYLPISAKQPWTNALEGKKVLVVSQFADFLIEQYKKKKQIYNGVWMWPEIELVPVKSIWYFSKTKDSRFSSWFEALQYLYDEIMKNDFDIAILSCGPFAIDLASMIKRAGKQAIQLAGEVQMLFGIRGARWDDNEFYKKFYNVNFLDN